MDIYEFVSNRLNIDLKYDKSRLYYAKLSSMFSNHDFDNVFLIPVSLYNEIKLLIENNFKDESKTKRNTKLEVSLYLAIILLYACPVLSFINSSISDSANPVVVDSQVTFSCT